MLLLNELTNTFNDSFHLYSSLIFHSELGAKLILSFTHLFIQDGVGFLLFQECGKSKGKEDRSDETLSGIVCPLR